MRSADLIRWGLAITLTVSALGPWACRHEPLRGAVEDDPLPPGAVARLGSSRWRLGCGVRFLAFSPDGMEVAGGGNTCIRTWNSRTGETVRRIDRNPSPRTRVVNTPDGVVIAEVPSLGGKWISVGFSPDRKTFAATDESITIWDVPSGKAIRGIKVDARFLGPVVISPDGKTLAAAAGNNAIYQYEMETGKELRKFTGLLREAGTLAFSPDGKILAGAGNDGVIVLWETGSGNVLRKLDGHEGEILSLSFSPDGRKLASTGGDKIVREWDYAIGKEIRRLEGHGRPVTVVVYSPDGNTLMTGSLDGTVSLWDGTTGKERWKGGHSTDVLSGAFSPDGARLASGDADGRVRVWNVASGREESTPGHQKEISALGFSPDGSKVVSASFDRSLRLWEVVSGKEIWALENALRTTDVAFSPDGKTVICVERDGTLRSLESKSGKEIWTVGGSGTPVCGLFYTTDGKFLVSGDEDGVLCFRDARTGRESRKIRSGDRRLYGVACSPDGKVMASTGRDSAIQVWEVETGRMLWKEEGILSSDDQRVPLSFSPDGKYLAGGSSLHIALWDVKSEKRLEDFKETSSYKTQSMMFSGDGRGILLLTDDGLVLWDVVSRERVFQRWENGGNCCMALSLDGRRIAMGDRTGTILVWDFAEMAAGGNEGGADVDPQVLWDDLAHGDPSTGWRAVWSLVKKGSEGVRFLSSRMTVVPRQGSWEVLQYIDELGSAEAGKREGAYDKLAKLGFAAEPALREVLASGSYKGAEEVVSRCRKLIASLEAPKPGNPDARRQLRCVQVLENLATREARDLLKQAADGGPSRLTEEAKVALGRWDRRFARQGGGS